MLTIDRIRHAAEVLSSVVRRTDMIRAPRINCDSEIYLKTENLQVTGSFKVRGAYYKISQLTEEEKKVLPYVVLSIQFICVAYFADKEQFVELAKVNEQMLLRLMESKLNLMF